MHWHCMGIGGQIPPLLDLPAGRLSHEIVAG
jgi:hypothetical protein